MSPRQGPFHGPGGRGPASTGGSAYTSTGPSKRPSRPRTCPSAPSPGPHTPVSLQACTTAGGTPAAPANPWAPRSGRRHWSHPPCSGPACPRRSGEVRGGQGRRDCTAGGVRREISGDRAALGVCPSCRRGLGVRTRKEALSRTPWSPRQRGQDSRGSCSGNRCPEVTDVMVPTAPWPVVTTQPQGPGDAGLPRKCQEAGTGMTWLATLVTSRSRSGHPAPTAHPDGGLAAALGLPQGPSRVVTRSSPACVGWTRTLSDGEGRTVGPPSHSINPPSEIPTANLGGGRRPNTVIRNNFQLLAAFEDGNCN